MKLFKHFTNQSRITFNAVRQSLTASSDIFWVLFQLGTESNKKKEINSFIVTHFLSLIAFRKKFYCRKIIINSYITHFLSHINQEQILMNEYNYQQLYHTFSGSHINWEHNQIQYDKYQQLYPSFLESDSIQKQIVL